MTMPISVRAKDGGRIGGPVYVATAVEVDLVWNIAQNKQVRNILHGIVGAFSPSVAISQAVYAAIIASAAWTAYKPYVNSAAQFAGVWIKDLRGPVSYPYYKSSGAATAGTGAALQLPPGVAACVNLSTLFAGRNARGRVYLPGLDSASMNTTTGLFLAAFQTAAQNFITAVQTALTTSSITLAVLNPARAAYTGRTGTVHAARNAAILAVNANSMERLVASSQRRRAYL
jgi:hypothetical protein